MHEKEKVIGPILRRSFAISYEAPKDLETDQFGSFSGEIKREQNALETARIKCKYTLDKYHGDICIASEGSFGPHPTYFFSPCDDEIMILIDRRYDLEIACRHLSTSTNFNSATIDSFEKLEEFAKNAGFPKHALILRSDKYDQKNSFKGICSWKHLHECYRRMTERHNSVFVETDMRAMHNPLRMQVIRELSRKLVQKMNALCPSCKFPGFDITDSIPGLPCKRCGLPTKSPIRHVLSCQKCNHNNHLEFPNDKRSEDPMFCDFCNP